MTDIKYLDAQYNVEVKLSEIIDESYGPDHTIDILKECIKILQPYAEKEREKTHA